MNFLEQKKDIGQTTIHTPNLIEYILSALMIESIKFKFIAIHS